MNKYEIYIDSVDIPIKYDRDGGKPDSCIDVESREIHVINGEEKLEQRTGRLPRQLIFIEHNTYRRSCKEKTD